MAYFAGVQDIQILGLETGIPGQCLTSQKFLQTSSRLKRDDLRAYRCPHPRRATTTEAAISAADSSDLQLSPNTADLSDLRPAPCPLSASRIVPGSSSAASAAAYARTSDNGPDASALTVNMPDVSGGASGTPDRPTSALERAKLAVAWRGSAEDIRARVAEETKRWRMCAKVLRQREQLELERLEREERRQQDAARRKPRTKTPSGAATLQQQQQKQLAKRAGKGEAKASSSASDASRVGEPEAVTGITKQEEMHEAKTDLIRAHMMMCMKKIFDVYDIAAQLDELAAQRRTAAAAPATAAAGDGCRGAGAAAGSSAPGAAGPNSSGSRGPAAPLPQMLEACSMLQSLELEDPGRNAGLPGRAVLLLRCLIELLKDVPCPPETQPGPGPMEDRATGLGDPQRQNQHARPQQTPQRGAGAAATGRRGGHEGEGEAINSEEGLGLGLGLGQEGPLGYERRDVLLERAVVLTGALVRYYGGPAMSYQELQLVAFLLADLHELVPRAFGRRDPNRLDYFSTPITASGSTRGGGGGGSGSGGGPLSGVRAQLTSVGTLCRIARRAVQTSVATLQARAAVLSAAGASGVGSLLASGAKPAGPAATTAARKGGGSEAPGQQLRQGQGQGQSANPPQQAVAWRGAAEGLAGGGEERREGETEQQVPDEEEEQVVSVWHHREVAREAAAALAEAMVTLSPNDPRDRVVEELRDAARGLVRDRAKREEEAAAAAAGAASSSPPPSAQQLLPQGAAVKPPKQQQKQKQQPGQDQRAAEAAGHELAGQTRGSSSSGAGGREGAAEETGVSSPRVSSAALTAAAAVYDALTWLPEVAAPPPASVPRTALARGAPPPPECGEGASGAGGGGGGGGRVCMLRSGEMGRLGSRLALAGALLAVDQQRAPRIVAEGAAAVHHVLSYTSALATVRQRSAFYLLHRLASVRVALLSGQLPRELAAELYGPDVKHGQVAFQVSEVEAAEEKEEKEEKDRGVPARHDIDVNGAGSGGGGGGGGGGSVAARGLCYSFRLRIASRAVQQWLETAAGREAEERRTVLCTKVGEQCSGEKLAEYSEKLFGRLQQQGCIAVEPEPAEGQAAVKIALDLLLMLQRRVRSHAPSHGLLVVPILNDKRLPTDAAIGIIVGMESVCNAHEASIWRSHGRGGDNEGPGPSSSGGNAEAVLADLGSPDLSSESALAPGAKENCAAWLQRHRVVLNRVLCDWLGLRNTEALASPPLAGNQATRACGGPPLPRPDAVRPGQGDGGDGRGGGEEPAGHAGYEWGAGRGGESSARTAQWYAADLRRLPVDAGKGWLTLVAVEVKEREPWRLAGIAAGLCKGVQQGEVEDGLVEQEEEEEEEEEEGLWAV